MSCSPRKLDASKWSDYIDRNNKSRDFDASVATLPCVLINLHSTALNISANNTLYVHLSKIHDDCILNYSNRVTTRFAKFS